MSVSPLTLAPAWRTLLYHHQDIATTSSIYRELCDTFLSRNKYLLPDDVFDYWDASQDSGLVEFSGLDKKLSAQFQFLATFNLGDNSFLWADENSSLKTNLVEDAKRFRKKFEEHSYTHFAKLNCWPRDAVTILSKAVKELDCDIGYAGKTRSGLVLLTLREIVEIDDVPNATSEHEAESLSPISMIQELIDQKIREVQPEDHDLLQIEKFCADAHQAYKCGQYETAVEIVKQAKDKLGEPIGNKEPSGWLFLCEGCALLAMGEKTAAQDAFQQAGRALVSIDKATQLLGLARSSDSSEDRRTYLMASYIRDHEVFLANANSDEQSEIEALQADLFEETRAFRSEPRSAWAAAMTSYSEVEMSAYEQSMKRKEIKSEEGEKAASDYAHKTQADYNLAYRKFCLAWLTPGRHPNLSHFANKPSYGPNVEDITSCSMHGEGQCTIETTANNNSMSPGSRTRYELVRYTSPFNSETSWMINKIWSVWDHEEFEVFE